MKKQFRSTQFREYLIASLFAIIAQFHAMKWRKLKQSLRTIPRNVIPIILVKYKYFGIVEKIEEAEKN